MIKTVLVDDEKANVNDLTKLLEEHFSDCIEIIDSYSTVDEALKGINIYKPDLLFLDIQLEGKTAFQLIDKLEYKAHNIVFITAFNDYATEAFEVNAINYLLKPISLESLKKTIEKVKQDYSQKNFYESLHNLFDSHKRSLESRTDLTVQNQKAIAKFSIEGAGTKNYLIPIANIISVRMESKIVKFNLIDRETQIDLHKTLEEVYKTLEKHNFYNINRACLLNVQHLDYYNSNTGEAKMSDGSVYIVSERTRKRFKNYIHNLK